MKHKVFKDEDGELVCFYKLNNHGDLFDTKRFKPRGFKDLKSVTGHKHEYQAFRFCKRLIKEFFKLLAEEMIYNRVAFIMPQKDSFMVCIKETTDPDRDDYIYLLETGGRYYKPVLRWNNPKYRAAYNVRFNRIWRKKLIEHRLIKKK